MKFTVENATDSPEVNQLSQLVFDAANLTGDERKNLRITLTCGGTPSQIISSVTNCARIHSLFMNFDSRLATYS